MLFDTNVIVILHDRHTDGYTAADVIVNIKGKYALIDDEIVLPGWQPISRYKDMCYPKGVPARLAMFVSGVVGTIEALTRVNPSWRYIIAD